MKKVILPTIIAALSTTAAQAENFDILVKWKNQADYQAAFDTPKQALKRAQSIYTGKSKVVSKATSPVSQVNALSGYTLEHVRSGANRTDSYQVEAGNFEALQTALMATGYFEHVSLNTFYKTAPIKFEKPVMSKKVQAKAKAKGMAQIQSVETYAFNDPYFSEQVVFQPQGDFTMGAANFLDAINYVSANKQMTRKVRVAILDTGKWEHEDITWADDEADLLSGSDAATCASGDPEHGGEDVICPASDYQIGVRDNDATAKLWKFAFDGNGNPISDGEVWVGGHGLSVASAVAAKNDNGLGITAGNDDGDVELIPVRIIDSVGASQMDIVDGIYWAAGMSVPGLQDISQPVDIINMSLGGLNTNGCSEALQEAIDYAYERGITVITAAGNSTIDAANFSTSCENSLTVGAHTLSGEITSFSNFGESIELTMLGSQVHTAIISDTVYKGNNSAVIDDFCKRPDGTLADVHGCYTTTSGTSIAAPLATSMVAQVILVNPDFTPDELMAVVTSTAARYDENEIGQATKRKTLFPNAGLGNAYEAVASTFSSALIETGEVSHQFANVVTLSQALYVEAMGDIIGKDKVCEAYQASFGYFDKPVANVHYEIYQSNSQDDVLTTSNSEYIPPKGGGVLEYPSTTVNMSGATRLGVRACDDGSCGEIFELDLSSAQKPSYCL